MGKPRTLAIAAFAFVIATTPLGSLLNGGVHEAWMPASALGFGWGRVKVIVEDRTGLVAGIAASDWGRPDPSPDDRMLVLGWLGGCSDQQIWLTLRAVGDGYRVDKSEIGNGCPFMVGIGRTVTMVTRAPVDPARVAFDAPEATIR